MTWPILVLSSAALLAVILLVAGDDIDKGPSRDWEDHPPT